MPAYPSFRRKVTAALSSLSLSMIVMIAASTSSSSCSKDPSQQGQNQSQERVIQKGDLTRAVIFGQEDEVLALIYGGANVNENIGTSSMQITPLIAAAISNQPNIARGLLMSGADPEARILGYSSKDLAFALEHQEIYQQLR